MMRKGDEIFENRMFAWIDNKGDRYTSGIFQLDLDRMLL